MGSFKSFLLWAVAFGAVVFLFGHFRSEPDDQLVTYSEFMDRALSGEFAEVTVEGQRLVADGDDNLRVATVIPNDIFMISELRDAGVEINVEEEEGRSLWLTLLISWFPMLLLLFLMFFLLRNISPGGRGGAFSFGKHRAQLIDAEDNKVTFADVAGCEEAKDEVRELVDFLSEPEKFRKIGARIPRGILMVGGPGTGKTLLARAIAGEAEVPFFSLSGADFVEMFVGVGASRVRDLFEQAKEQNGCIIFIDEIDAVGRQRGVGLGGGNDEREQTLNQLLVEMDGFEKNQTIIVIAATNRPDVLDPALLRPGRFDRQVVVPLPDIRGRTEILKVHMRDVPIDGSVKAEVLARGTPGMAGADLANLVNEASIRAGRLKSKKVTMGHFEYAKEKILMGTERRSMVMSQSERQNTAYHESGHAIVARLLKHTDPVHKVTIIPRGRALGVTMQLPTEDRYCMTNLQILDNICVLLGGRVAEELFMQQMTTGASNDFERATAMARRMVAQWGMSDSLGTMVYGGEETDAFLGRAMGLAGGGNKQVSEVTMREVDGEIRKIIDAQYTQAKQLLATHRDKVEAMTKALLEWETIDEKQIDAIMDGRDIPPPEFPPKQPAKPKATRRRKPAKKQAAGKADKGDQQDLKPAA